MRRVSGQPLLGWSRGLDRACQVVYYTQRTKRGCRHGVRHVLGLGGLGYERGDSRDDAQHALAWFDDVHNTGNMSERRNRVAAESVESRDACFRDMTLSPLSVATDLANEVDISSSTKHKSTAGRVGQGVGDIGPEVQSRVARISDRIWPRRARMRPRVGAAGASGRDGAGRRGTRLVLQGCLTGLARVLK